VSGRLGRISLATRLLLTATLALAVALAAIGLVMHEAFSEKTRDLVEERLESYLFGLLSTLEPDARGQFVLTDNLPEPRLSRPASGLYAELISDQQQWQSPSQLGIKLPATAPLPAGKTRFEQVPGPDNRPIFRLRRGLVWETDNGKEIPFTLSVSEDASGYFRELAEFRKNLWTWLLFASVILIGVQGLILGWSLRPLKRLTEDVQGLETGHRETLGDDYPSELSGLTQSVNDLIRNERSNLERQRKTLGDLAHSLKTPLAVVHAELEKTATGQTPDSDLLREQVSNMDDIVAYQLQRAAVAGHRTFTSGVPVIDKVQQIKRTLDKVYRQKKVQTRIRVAPGAEFFGEHGDLMELLGNLLENAYKWCDRNVWLEIRTLTHPGRRRTGLRIEVADDGPGIPAEQREQLLKRGVRGDERGAHKPAGHGIGLSIVADIVEAYGGELRIDRHPELGGAWFVITLPP